METSPEKLNEFIERVDNMKKQEKMDLSSDQDLSIAIMNLVSIEEHFFFSGAKTEQTKYFEMINEVREMRKELLKKIVKNPEGETWCISKHLLAASMRLFEVGTKALSSNKKEEAFDYFRKSYNLYSLFWGLNLNVIDARAVQKIDEQAINKHDEQKSGFMGKLGTLVKRAIDCCIE